MNSFTIKQKKIRILIVIFLCLLILLNGCNELATVTIITDRTVYISSMSSARGIKLTPEFNAREKYAELEYHWQAEAGEFLGISYIGKETTNQGETVLWSAVQRDKSVEINKAFEIKLEVINKTNSEVLASTKITINGNKGIYEVEED